MISAVISPPVVVGSLLRSTPGSNRFVATLVFVGVLSIALSTFSRTIGIWFGDNTSSARLFGRLASFRRGQQGGG